MGDIITLNYGKALKESDRNDGEYPVVGSAGISGSHSQYSVAGPGIVVGRKGSAGNVIWCNDNFWPIDTAYWVSLNNTNISLYYSYLLLKSLKLENLVITTAIPGLNRDDVYEQIVSVPDNTEQNEKVCGYRKIISVKDKSNDKITSSMILKQELINKIFLNR